MSAPPTPFRDILYDRVSTMIQSLVGYSGGEDGYQVDACRSWSEAHGGTVIDTITDVDSGAKWNIRGLEDARARARRREYDRLIVYNTSRFARNASKKAVLEAELAHHGVQVVYLNVPEMDRSTPDGRAMGRIISDLYGAMDELDRDRRALTTAAGRTRKAGEGKVVGAGPAPYGYRYKKVLDEHRKREVTYGLEPHPDTAPIVRRIYDEAMTRSVVEIAAGLQADGVPLPAAWRPTPKRPLPTVWSTKTIHRILTDPVYRGAWSYGDRVGALDPADALVTAERQAAVALVLKRRSTRRAPRCPADEDPFTLRGLLVCGHCFGPLSINTGGGYRRYTCGRAIPSRCARYGWTACAGPLPMLLATDQAGRGIEDRAWEMVIALAESPEEFDRLLQRQGERHAEERAQWDETVGTLDGLIADQERRLRRAGEEMMRVERGSERYAFYAETEAAAEHKLKGLRAERAELLGCRPPGADPEQLKKALGYIDARLGVIGAGAERLREVARLRGLGPAERRRRLEVLGVRGVVTANPVCGVRVGRDARVCISWEVMGSETRLLKLVLLHTSAGLALAGLTSAAAA